MIRITLIFMFLFLSAVPAFADKLIFKNNDHITGKLISLRDGVITFETKSLGEITVKVKEVRTLSTDDPVEIHLDGGNVIFVAMGAVDHGFFAPKSPEARIYFVSDVVAIYRIEDCGPPPPPPDSDKSETEQKHKPSGKLSMDASLESGETEDLSTGIKLDIARKLGAHRLSADAGYLYAQSMDKISRMKTQTQDSFYALGKCDFSLQKKPFGYFSTRFETDRITDLDSKITTETGIDYDVIKKKDLSFKLKSNAELEYEKYGYSDSERDISASFGWHLDKKISSKTLFQHDLKYIPESRDLNDLFLSTNAELKSNLTKSLFWNLKFAMEYDSRALSDDESTDIKYTLGITWDLF